MPHTRTPADSKPEQRPVGRLWVSPPCTAGAAMHPSARGHSCRPGPPAHTAALWEGGQSHVTSCVSPQLTPPGPRLPPCPGLREGLGACGEAGASPIWGRGHRAPGVPARRRACASQRLLRGPCPEPCQPPTERMAQRPLAGTGPPASGPGLPMEGLLSAVRRQPGCRSVSVPPQASSPSSPARREGAPQTSSWRPEQNCFPH